MEKYLLEKENLIIEESNSGINLYVGKPYYMKKVYLDNKIIDKIIKILSEYRKNN